MTGQGRPHRERLPGRWSMDRALRQACALTLLVLVATQASAADTSLRLRIEWGGGVGHRWTGRLSVTNGQLADPQPLGIEADEPGSVWEEDGRVMVATPSSRRYDGLDVTVVAPLDSKLLVELRPVEFDNDASPYKAGGPVIAFTLAQLVDDFQNQQLDQQGNRLLVRRAPGDKLRVELDRAALVYAPGERIAWQTIPNFPHVAAGTRVRLQAKLMSASNGRIWWNDERELALGPAGDLSSNQAFETTAPELEGVYDIVLTASRRNLTDRLALRGLLDERRVQLVVVGTARPAVSTAMPAWEVLAEIDPAHPRWWERVSQWQSSLPVVSQWRRGPLSGGETKPLSHALGTFVQLEPSQAGEPPRWEAYPLPVQRPGQPHVLEIEYPSDIAQSLGISIVEPNAAGAVLPIGLDSGVYVSPDAATTRATTLKHRLVFWPRTESPLVLITNRGVGTRGVHGKLRVLGPKGSSRSSLTNLSTSLVGRTPEVLPDVHLPASLPADAPRPERLLAAYFARPLLPENFSATGAVDSWSAPSGRALDDWTTFLQAGQRLVEYLRYAGHGGAMVSVYADGSSLYPSPLLQPTPRYDDGVLLAAGHDPHRKDVLELLLRLFDREPMTLITGLQFSAPLPELEIERRANGGVASGIELVGSDGRTWHETHTIRRELAPYYNPLDPRVQQAMLAVVRELAQRCKDHPSWGGIALQLSAEGFAQLPGAEWGCDEDTLGRFERETRVDLGPAGIEYLPQRAGLLGGKYRQAWLAWRARVMSDLYGRMADEIRAVQPSARLYLVTAELFQHPDLQELIRPNLPRIGQSDDLLLQVGLDASTLARDERMVLLRSQRIAPPDPLVAQGINLELNLDADLDAKLHSLAHPGVLFHHERQETALESFDARSPFRRSYTRLVTVASPSAEQNQRRFIQALAAQDCQACFDGGWLLPLGQEAALADLFAIYRQLPAASFQTVEGKTQPVTIRTLEGDHRSYVYLVNDSPWRVSVNLTTTAAGQFRMQQLGGSRRVFSLHGDGTQRVCNVDLGPYELAAAAFDGRVRVSNAKVNLPALLADQLDARIRDLWNRAASLKNAAPISGVANADFEQAARRDAVPPGWELKPIKGAIATVDNRHAHGGTQSVRMTADAAGAEMRTAPLMIPKTGRLSISVWMRTADPQRQPTLRLGVEGTGVNPYVRYATVGAAPGGQPLADTWGQFVLPIHDLPTDLGQQLHVKFELVGAGEVWIDDVQLFDLDFSEEERLELSKSLTLIEYKRESGEYRDCLRLLDGYWPRFLTTFVPAVEQPLVRRPAKPEASPAAAEPEPRTGLMDRLRRSLPEFMR